MRGPTRNAALRRPLVTRIRFEGFGEGNLFALRAQTSPPIALTQPVLRAPGVMDSPPIVVLQALYDSKELDQKKRGVL